MNVCSGGPGRMTRVYLIDDHPTFRAGLRTLLEAEGDFRVVGEAGNGKVALGQLRLLAADLVILDIGLADANGLHVIPELLSIKPDVKIVVLTMHRDWSYLDYAREQGARGYLLKDSEPDVLVTGFRAVAEGSLVYPDNDRASGGKSATNDDARVLTAREREILRLVGRGMLSREIADTLQISVRTVESHRTRMIEKLELKGAAELVKFAVRQNLD